jgi:hypothetical protein
MSALELKDRPIAPYSLRFQRGGICNSLDADTSEGRFARELNAHLVKALGREPTIHDQLLIDLVIRLKLQFDAIIKRHAKLLAHNKPWMNGDQRMLNMLSNQIRLTLRELKNSPSPSKKRGRPREELMLYLAEAMADEDQG